MKADAGVVSRPWDFLPWVRRERDRKAINGQIVRLKQTAHAIRADHGLDQLAEDIEKVRDQGQEAMEKDDNAAQEEPEERRTSSA